LYSVQAEAADVQKSLENTEFSGVFGVFVEWSRLFLLIL
jgi:hypothetical protein